MKREAWIIDAARTPRGVGNPDKGALAGIHPQRLLSTVLKAIATRNNIRVDDIDDVIAGVNTQAGKQGLCLGRMAALDAGFPNSVVGVSLDRFCGSGLTAVNIAAMGVISGMQDLVFAGGVECMSHTRTLAREFMLDSQNLDLRKRIPQAHQGICADIIATLEGVSRDALDAFGAESQRRTRVAMDEGRFGKSLIPVVDASGNVALANEEYPRPQTTVEKLAQLNPAFQQFLDKPIDKEGATYGTLVRQVFPDLDINFVHTAGTSSGVVDGAGAILVASSDYARSQGLKPRARIRAATTAGDDPVLMLNGPAPAARKALKQAGMSVKDIDLYEVNEAFAIVPIKFARELDVDPERINPNGGAIAMGHPIGATGAILAGTLLDELERRDMQTGLVTLCAAGGMAPAMIIERI